MNLVDEIIDNGISLINWREFYQCTLISAKYSEFKKIFELYPNLNKQYFSIGDKAFLREIDYDSGDLLNNFNDPKMVDYILNIFVSNSENNQEFDFISAITYKPSLSSNVYMINLNGLFTNPKYQRQGYARAILLSVIDFENEKSHLKIFQEEGNYENVNWLMAKHLETCYIATVFVWNQPSLNLFLSLNFRVVATERSKYDHNSEKAKKEFELFEYNGLKFPEDHYHTIGMPSKYFSNYREVSNSNSMYKSNPDLEERDRINS